MLRGREIQAIAARQKVRDTQIEKDYVISWLLWGISQNGLLCENLVFKGGTVLKKAWFSDYRFSEDLDFTLLDSGLSDEVLLSAFGEICPEVEAASGIQLKIGEPEKHQSGSIAFYAYFVASLGGKMESKSIKIDLTRGEKLFFQTLERPIFKDYTDLPQEDFSLKCYPLEEILIEKLVALMGRTQPRDLYDLWYLLENESCELEFLETEFRGKAEHKGHRPDDFHAVWSKKERQFRAAWGQYLAHQISELPDFERVLREINRCFRGFLK